VHSTSKHVLLRLAVSITVVAAIAVAWAGTALATPPAGKGTLEVCKSSYNGMSGRSFKFSITGGSEITVKGGRCSGPMQVPSGTVNITESPALPSDAATDVAAVRATPSNRLLTQNLAAKTVSVNVPADSTAANETRVTFINQPAGGNKGDLKICKVTETPAFVGRQFSFTVNGGPAISTEANNFADSPGDWSCRLAGSFQVGSKVTVKELIPAGTDLAWIDTDPADRLGNIDTNLGTAEITIGSGVTVALYDNEAPQPQGNGYLEICKDRARLDYHGYDDAVQGEFEFHIEYGLDESQDVTVLAGQCSEPLLVAAGVAHVTEAARTGISLVKTFTIPEERWLGDNLINRTADVEVPVSDDPNDETQLHFVNQAERGQLKICKALGPNSSVLEGQKFHFEADHPGESDDDVYITAAAQTQCKIVSYLPVGAEIQVDEDLGFPGAEYIKASGPGCAYDEDGDLECNLTIKPGINTVTITNTARGKLEICKFVTDRLTDGELFHKEFTFKIDGTMTVKVRPGYCSPPQLVTVGSHTVTESAENNYELDPNAFGNGIVVTPYDAETSRNLAGRSVTVNVPYAGDKNQIGREVRVDFYNRIKRAQIKVCKRVESGSLDSIGNKAFDFTVDVPGATGTPFHVTGVRNGECRLIAHSTGEVVWFPIIQSNGSPTHVTASEDHSGSTSGSGFMVSDIAVQGYRGTLDGPHCLNASPGCGGANSKILWDLGPNTNTVTFTNKAKADP
jgi:hypothetical protein